MIEAFDVARLEHYLSLRGDVAKVKKCLGYGTDGAVWATDHDTAIKVFKGGHHRGYANERDTYLRLAEFGVTQKIGDFWVPAMHDWEDKLLVVEMDVMEHAPYIIDFAKVRLNSPPEFPLETVKDNEERGRERFGNNWPAVQALLAELESYLIY